MLRGKDLRHDLWLVPPVASDLHEGGRDRLSPFARPAEADVQKERKEVKTMDTKGGAPKMPKPGAQPKPGTQQKPAAQPKPMGAPSPKPNPAGNSGERPCY